MSGFTSSTLSRETAIKFIFFDEENGVDEKIEGAAPDFAAPTIENK